MYVGILFLLFPTLPTPYRPYLLLSSCSENRRAWNKNNHKIRCVVNNILNLMIVESWICEPGQDTSQCGINRSSTWNSKRNHSTILTCEFNGFGVFVPTINQLWVVAPKNAMCAKMSEKAFRVSSLSAKIILFVVCFRTRRLFFVVQKKDVHRD